jgi:hypothetical protein
VSRSRVTIPDNISRIDKSCFNYPDLGNRVRLPWYADRLFIERLTYTLRTVPDFRLLTNHGNTLLLIARDPHIRIRDLATLLDITERAAQRIVADLISAEYLDRERVGRRNVYHVRTHLPLRLPFQRDLDVKSLLAIMATPDDQSGEAVPIES